MEGVHKNRPTESATYASVVSRSSVRVTLLLADLNDIEYLRRDIKGIYINLTCKEEVWFQARS